MLFCCIQRITLLISYNVSFIETTCIFVRYVKKIGIKNHSLGTIIGIKICEKWIMRESCCTINLQPNSTMVK